MGSWEKTVCILPEYILKTGEKRKVEGAMLADLEVGKDVHIGAQRA
jgi:hypothetical protein